MAPSTAFTPDSYEKGQKIWIPHQAQGWTPAEVFDHADEGRAVRIKSGDDFFLVSAHLKKGITIAAEDEEDGTKTNFPVFDLPPRDPHELDGVTDLTNISYLHEPAILNQLRLHFESQEIYMYTGSILIAVNPWQRLPLYGPEQFGKFQDQDLNEAPPHVYAFAEKAYRQMRDDRQSQTILVSGESGSGKTESCKLILEYITAVSSGGEEGSEEYAAVADRVLKSNPLLEAFGNAKTARNNNSSRFGKYLELQFTATDERIVGAKVETYLLEKSRVVKQSSDDRNFHIFYQLFRGADGDLKSSLHLGDHAESDFAFLSGGDSTQVEDIDDVADWAATIEAMAALGVTEDEKKSLFATLSGILHLGNVTFETKKEGGEDEAEAAIVSDDSETSPLAIASSLLGISGSDLAAAMCTRKLTVQGETVTRKFNVADAENARNALAKSIYQRVFEFIVEKVNSQTVAPRKVAVSPVTIGLLDIFGFEIFKENAFEQLNINYANEKLQQLFNKYIFKIEQSEYKREGIEWEHIDFTDNLEALSLIEKSPGGIIALLDEECKMQKGNDAQFANRLHSTNPDNAYLRRYPNPENCFAVHHYAGEVIYTSTGSVEKNRDPLHADLIPVMEASSCDLITALFPPTDAADAGPGTGPQAGQKIFSKSVISQFKGQLSDLMTKISATHPHFVRCVNSNSDKRPKTFFGSEVVTQLRYGGVIEAVRIMKHMYPTRVDHLVFYNKYASDYVWQCILKQRSPEGTAWKVLGPESTIEHAHEACTQLCEALQLEKVSAYQIGRSKVFFRFGEVAKIDKQRQVYLDDQATRIRAAFLRHRQQQEYSEHQRRQKAATRIQRCYRAGRRISGFRKIVFLARNEQLRLQHEAERAAKREAAALLLQTNFRGFRHRRDYRTLRTGIIKLQAARRGAVTRHSLKIENVESMFDAKTRLKEELERTRKKLRVEIGAKEALAQALNELQEKHDQTVKDLEASTDKCGRAEKQVASAAQLFSALERQKLVLERQIEDLETLNHTLIMQSSPEEEQENVNLRGSVGRASDVGNAASNSGIALTSEADIQTIVVRDGMKRSGWLTKLGAKTKSWKKRWFVLSGIGLQYFKSEKEKKPIDTIHFVDHVMIPVKDMTEVQFPKSVTVPEQCMKLFPRGDGRVWYFFSDSIKETEDWLSSLDVNKSMGTYLKKALITKHKPDQRVLSCVTDVFARVLFLDNQPLSLESCVALAQPLSHYQRLHTLSMHNAKLQARHIDVLTRSLSNHSSIKKLRLSKNELGNAGVHSLAKALNENNTLTQLMLEHNKIGDEGAKSLCQLIREDSPLTVLSLDGNDIGDEGCTALCDKLTAVKTFPLSTLALKMNKIGDAGAAKIAEMVASAECVENLQLAHNQIGDTGAKAIGAALASNNTVLHLNLDANQLTHEGIAALAAMLESNQCLLDINLGLSSMTSKQFSTTFAEHKFSLEVVFPEMTLKRRAAFRVSDAS